jgi:hypothetical protein
MSSKADSPANIFFKNSIKNENCFETAKTACLRNATSE